MKKEKGGTRAQIDRMNRILLLLRASGRRPMTKSVLAQKIHTSEKSIQRDIASLMDDHGYDIQRRDWKSDASGDQGGGYVLRDAGKPLILMDLTENEAMSILVASRCVEAYRGTPYEKPLRSAFSKLACLAGGKVQKTVTNSSELLLISSEALFSGDPAVFGQLVDSTFAEAAIRFEYLSPRTKKWESKHVEPHLLHFINDLWYLHAWDLELSDWRKYSIARVRKIFPTGAMASKLRRKQIRTKVRDSMGAFSDGKFHKVVLQLDETAAWYAEHYKWHPSQKLKKMKKGVVIEFPANGLEDVAQRILRWAPHVVALGPAQLRQLLAGRLQTAISDLRRTKGKVPNAAHRAT
jgi:predicted DNA-binding transcriptional regulator YafY